MQLAPRYGSEPVLTLDGPPAAIAVPAIRQRRRLADTLARFSDEQWAHPSRCDGWSARDVMVHLEETNGFWMVSTMMGLTGKPTRWLATFDPATSPTHTVTAARATSTDDMLAKFIAGTDSLETQWSELNDWTALGEAPPGHITISALVHHALWDSWIHERDILLPQGIAPVVEPDEVEACLRYVSALGPALALGHGVTQRGVFSVSTTSPDVRAVVDIGDTVHVRAGTAATELVLTGHSVDVLEALSTRRVITQPIPAGSAWMPAGLTQTFDIAPH